MGFARQGMTVAEMVESALPTATQRRHSVVFMAGEVIPEHMWPVVRPKAGTHVEIKALPVGVAANLAGKLHPGVLLGGELNRYSAPSVGNPPVNRPSRAAMRMSGLCGGLNGWTQHSNL